MNKAKLVEALVKQLHEELATLKAAARASHEAATHEESKPENEYDTRALEASYLAGAQAKRAAEIDEVLSMLMHSEFKPFAKDTGISSTALVEVEAARKRTYVLLMPLGGGVGVQFEGTPVQIITPHSLLGEALLGLRQGDVAEIEIGGTMREYNILSVN